MNTHVLLTCYNSHKFILTRSSRAVCCLAGGNCIRYDRKNDTTFFSTSSSAAAAAALYLYNWDASVLGSFCCWFLNRFARISFLYQAMSALIKSTNHIGKNNTGLFLARYLIVIHCNHLSMLFRPTQPFQFLPAACFFFSLELSSRSIFLHFGTDELQLVQFSYSKVGMNHFNIVVHLACG